MSYIVVSDNKRDLKLVSCKHLTRLKNNTMSLLPVLLEMLIKFADILVGNPGICINDSQDDTILVNLVRIEVTLL